MKAINGDIAKFGTKKRREKHLKVYADRRGPLNSEKLAEERIQSHIKEHTRKLKRDKKLKHRWRDPSCGVSSYRSTIARAMRGHNPKVPNFSALRNQLEIVRPDSPSELVIPSPNSSTSEFQQIPPPSSTIAISLFWSKQATPILRRLPELLPKFIYCGTPKETTQSGRHRKYTANKPLCGGNCATNCRRSPG